MMHTENYMKGPAEILHALLKALSMFKISICYDNITVHEKVLYYMGIMCIHCGETIYCALYNKPIEVVTNVVYQNVGLSWIIELKNNLIYILSPTVLFVCLIYHGTTL